MGKLTHWIVCYLGPAWFGACAGIACWLGRPWMGAAFLLCSLGSTMAAIYFGYNLAVEECNERLKRYADDLREVADELKVKRIEHEERRIREE